jgi:hypothetical protein
MSRVSLREFDYLLAQVGETDWTMIESVPRLVKDP